MVNKIYYYVLLLILLVACNNHGDDIIYLTQFHPYHWEVDSIPVFVPSSVFDGSWGIKDNDGNIGSIIGVTTVLSLTQRDTITIYNTELENDRNTILSDTIQRDWFTIINEKERLRVLLNENEGTDKRILQINIWSAHRDYVGNGEPVCEGLTLIQSSLK